LWEAYGACENQVSVGPVGGKHVAVNDVDWNLAEFLVALGSGYRAVVEPFEVFNTIHRV
jgi:hypothetical protein